MKLEVICAGVGLCHGAETTIAGVFQYLLHDSPAFRRKSTVSKESKDRPEHLCMGVGHLASTAAVVASDRVCGQLDHTMQETVAGTFNNTAGKRGLACRGEEEVGCVVTFHPASRS